MILNSIRLASLVMLVMPLTVNGQATPKTATIGVTCYGPDASRVKDELLYYVFRGTGAGIHQRGTLPDGNAVIELNCGKPVSIIVRSRDRSYVPYCIPPIAAHEGATPGQFSLAMNRETNSIEGKTLIELAARVASEAAPGSDVALDLQDWANGVDEVKKRPALTAAELKAVGNCLAIIRGCQLPDGAFLMKSHGRSPSSPVWVPPYFVNYSALAMLAANEREKNPADVARVGAWLAWCAKNQHAAGYWTDFEGTVLRYQSNGKVDAWDSSAALFLLVVERYQRSGGEVSPAVLAAAKNALRCIQTVTDPDDGLTWATPTYKVKFLMDNIETYAGLAVAAKMFGALGAGDEAEQARRMAQRIRQKLPDYWQAEQNLFAFALHQNGAFETGLDKLYPHGLAQLFAIGFVADKPEAWTQVQAKFLPDEGDAAAAGVERWLVAASRLGGDTEKDWRLKVTRAADSFSSQNVYIYRPGVAALSLLEGADWMPSSFVTVEE